MNEEKYVEFTEIEPVDEFEVEVVDESSGIGTGLAMLIGSGLTVAAIVAGKKLMKVWKDRKAKKEQKYDEFDEFDVAEVDDEEADSEDDGSE